MKDKKLEDSSTSTEGINMIETFIPYSDHDSSVQGPINMRQLVKGEVDIYTS